jgi:uncharacterized protein YjbI with pentapeptide repeats
VRVAITVIRRRDLRHDQQPIDLAGAHLTDADLTDVHLTDADLLGADLTIGGAP